MQIVLTSESSLLRWLSGQEKNGAARLGLFRIVFAAFYLWHLSLHHAESLVHILAIAYHQPHVVLSALSNRLGTSWLTWLPHLESALVAALVLLFFGRWTRIVTGFVLVLGSLYECVFMMLDVEHSTVFLTFYIPLFMFLTDAWGRRFSLDRRIAQQAAARPIEAAREEPRYSLAVRAILVLFCALFLSAALAKVVAPFWLAGPDQIRNSLSAGLVSAALAGSVPNPVGSLLIQSDWLLMVVAYGVVLFEGLFVLALRGGLVRDVIMALGVSFHAVNSLWFGVTFTPVLIVYALFVDWMAVAARLPARLRRLALPTISMLSTSRVVAVAAACAWMWNSEGHYLRRALNLDGMLDMQTVFLPVMACVALWVMHAVGRGMSMAIRCPRA